MIAIPTPLRHAHMPDPHPLPARVQQSAVRPTADVPPLTRLTPRATDTFARDGDCRFYICLFYSYVLCAARPPEQRVYMAARGAMREKMLARRARYC